MQLLAKDGIYLHDAPRLVEWIILSPGNRADVAVRCFDVGMEYMNTTFIDLRCTPKSPMPNYGCFEPSNQYGPESIDTGVEDRVGVFMDPNEQPTILAIDVVRGAPLESFTVKRPCYLVDLQNAEIDGHFENRYGCLNAGQIDIASPTRAGWPDIATPKDICGVFGPYGVGGGTIDDFTPWVDEDTYINDFEAGSIQEVGK